MKSLLIFCGILTGLSQVCGIRFEQRWASRPQQNATEICNSAPNWTILPHLGNCRKFYACVNHITEEFYCAESQHFDRIQLRCMPGACHDTPMTSTACQPHAVTRDADNCSAFSYCSGDGQRRSKEYCPPGSYYHAGYGMCLAISVTADHKCACLLPERTTLANPDDCETYFVCEEGRAKLRQCPRGQYYEAAISACLPDFKQKCLMAPTMSSMEALTLSGVCQRTTMAGKIFHAMPEDCSRFYVCLQGRVFTRQCGKGFYFDSKWNYCRLDVQGKCSGRLSWKQPETVGVWTQPQVLEMQNSDENNMNGKKEHIENEYTTEVTKSEIQYASTQEDNKETQTTVAHNNYKSEREILNTKEKQTEELTKLQQKPTPTKTANDKLFSKFIKFA